MKMIDVYIRSSILVELDTPRSTIETRNAPRYSNPNASECNKVSVVSRSMQGVVQISSSVVHLHVLEIIKQLLHGNCQAFVIFIIHCTFRLHSICIPLLLLLLCLV